MTEYDLIIIGGGPGGLTAAIYAARERIKTLLLEKGLVGGAAAATEFIENYPGFPEGIEGPDLMARFKKQAEKFGVEIIELKEVKKIIPEGDAIEIRTDKERFTAYAVIIASGAIPRNLNIPGEKEYAGKGVSYCGICDGPLYRGKDIAVIGGGDAAAEEALSLTRFARQIILVHRRQELRAAKILQEELKRNKKIKLFLNHIPVSINGKDVVTSITVQDKGSIIKKDIEVSGVFIYVGFLPNSKFLGDLIKLNESGYIITNEKMETSLTGIYAVGDVREKELKQVDVACAEGTIAALSAARYIEKKKKEKDNAKGTAAAI